MPPSGEKRRAAGAACGALSEAQAAALRDLLGGLVEARRLDVAQAALKTVRRHVLRHCPPLDTPPPPPGAPAAAAGAAAAAAAAGVAGGEQNGAQAAILRGRYAAIVEAVQNAVAAHVGEGCRLAGADL